MQARSRQACSEGGEQAGGGQVGRGPSTKVPPVQQMNANTRPRCIDDAQNYPPLPRPPTEVYQTQKRFTTDGRSLPDTAGAYQAMHWFECLIQQWFPYHT